MTNKNPYVLILSYFQKRLYGCEQGSLICFEIIEAHYPKYHFAHRDLSKRACDLIRSSLRIVKDLTMRSQLRINSWECKSNFEYFDHAKILDNFSGLLFEALVSIIKKRCFKLLIT